MSLKFKKTILFIAIIGGFFAFLLPTKTNAALDWKHRLYDNQHFVRPSGVGNFANPNLLYTISLPTEPDISSSNGFMGGSVVGDVDGDGKQEIVVGARINDYDNYLYVYNGITGQLKNSLFLGSDTVSSSWENYVLGILLADLDSDGILDIITNSWAVRAHKGSDLSLMWKSATTTGGYLQFATVADVDGNGTVELLVPDYGSPRKLHLFNGQTGNEIWSFNAGSSFNTPLVADINSDGNKEIVFTGHDTPNERVYALDKDGNQLWTYGMPIYGYISPSLADFDNDGIADILVGSDEAVVLLNASTGALKWSYSTGADSRPTHYFFTKGAAIGDINNDGVLDIAFDFADSDDHSRSGLFVLKGSDGTLQWSKTFPSSSPPYRNLTTSRWGSATMADFDNDGNLEVLFGYTLFTDDGADTSDYVEWHVIVYDGSGNKEFSIDNLMAPTYSADVAVADVNNDNILDIIIQGGWFNKIFVYIGGGQASQRISVNLTVPSGGSTGGGNTGGGPGGSDVPPIIFNVATSTSFTTATISWSASDDLGISSSNFVYGPTISYGNSAAATGTYKVNLSGLATGTLYYYKISATDTGNHTAEYTGIFSTSPLPPDTTPPIISGAQVSIGVTTATIQWDTNESADSQVIYGLTTAYGSNYFDSAQILAHSATLSGLIPATLYHFKIISTDSVGNSAHTSDSTFTTRADSIPPPDASGFILTTTTNSIVLSWINPSLAGTPDFSLVKVVRKIGSASANPADGTVVYSGTGQSYIDTNTSANINYFYTLFSFDTSNNNSPGIFRDGQVVSVSLPAPIEICGNGLDDNGNGAADCADIACASLPECALLPPPPSIGPEICGNGLDDDVNGLADCADSACFGYSGCGVGAFVPACSNGADDDGDGKIDYPNDGGCESANDNDEYSPPISSVPAFAKISLADLEFLIGNRLVKLEQVGGIITGLSGANFTVAVPEKILASAPQSIVLKVGDTDQHQFVYNANDKMYYADLSFYGVGMAQAYLEIDYGSGQFDSVAFKLNSLPWGQVVDSDDKPLTDVKITLRSTGGKDINMGVYGQINPIISDANGSYGWMVPDGDYQIFLQKEGYYDRAVARGNIVNNVINEKLGLIAKPLVLALVIDPEAPLVENVVNVAKNLAAQAQVLSIVAVQKIQDVAADPEVQKANQQVVAPTAITVVAAGAISFISWMDFLPFLRLMFLQPLMLLGLRKREKWGLVYNSLNKLPVDLAMVRLINLETNRVVQSRVTDANGHFVFMVEPGEYRLEAQKNNFIFPSKFLEGSKTDGQKVDIYHGEPIEVASAASITATVPLDPVGAQKKPLRLVLEKFGRRLQTALSVVGILVTIASLYISPKLYIAVLLAAHILLFFVFRKLAVPPKTKNWGIVYDETAGKPIAKVFARLFNSQFNKLVDTQITDSGGRYHFMAGDAKYYVTYEHREYHPQKTDIIDLEGKEAEAITLDIKLKRQ